MVKLTQRSWLGGQLDGEMLSRQDIARYRSGASELTNLCPRLRGAAGKREGTDLVADITQKTGGKAFRLVPFAYLPGEGWAVLFCDAAAWAVSAAGGMVAVGGGVPYAAAELAGLHWCQCGDTLYLAHRSHPPAKIEHTLSGQTHAFAWSELPVAGGRSGQPRVSGAVMKRLAVTSAYRGGLKTERYRASAVRDGVEGLPGPAYYREKGSSESSEEGTRSVTNTTQYYLPWTESQTITLSFDYNNPEGAGNPDQIRVYKVHGGVWGLIGVIDTSSDELDYGSAAVSDGANPSGLSEYEGVSGDAAPLAAEDAEDYNFPLGGVSSSTGRIVIDLGSARTLGRLDVFLGLARTKIIPEGDPDAGKLGVWYLPGVPTAPSWLDVEYWTGSAWVSALAARVQVSGMGSKTFKKFAYYPGESDPCPAAAAWVRGLAYTSKIELPFLSQVDTDQLRLSCYSSATGTTLRTGSWTTSDTAAWTTSGNPLTLSRVRLYSNATVDEFVDDCITPDASVTPLEDGGFARGAGDWPNTVALCQQRLVWAGSDNDPARVWMSRVGDFGCYDPHQVPVADDPIDFMLPITRFGRLNHIVEMRHLLCFSEDCEWVVSSSSGALAYDTVEARPHSCIGSDPTLAPIVCNNAVLFAERAGRAVRRYGYRLEDDGYGGRDISVFSRALFADNPIVDWAYRQHPEPTVWCALRDGRMASLLWMEDGQQDICAWAGHELGGGGKCLALCATHALHGPDGGRSHSELLLAVRRGSAVTLERMRCRPRPGGDAVANALCLDSCREVSAGDTLRAGATLVNPATGAWSEVSAARAAADAEDGFIEGFRYAARMVSVYPDFGAERPGGGSEDVRSAVRVAVRVAGGVGGTARPLGAPAAMASRLDRSCPGLSAAALLDGEGGIALPRAGAAAALAGVNDTDGRVVVEQNLPWPFELASMEVDYATDLEGE